MRRRFIISILISLSLIIGAFAFLFTSHSGLQCTLRLASWILPGKIMAASIEGRLISGFTLTNLIYQTESEQLTVSRLMIQWQVWQLWRGQLPIQQVNLQNVKIYQYNAQGQKEPFLSLSQLVGHGTVGLFPNQPLQAEISWQELAWIREKQNYIHDGNGQLQIKGARTNYLWQLTTQLPSKTFPGSDWKLIGQGNNHKLILNHGTTKLLSGQLLSTGWLDWQHELTWNLVTQAQHLNPGLQWPDLSGDMNFQLTFTGTAGKETSYTIQLDNLTGHLHNQRLAGNGLLKTHGPTIDTATLHLTAGNAIIDLEGQLAQQWNMRWRIDIDELQGLISHSQGSFHSMGTIKGKRLQPNTSLTAKGKDIQFGSYAIQNLSADGNISLDRDTASQFELLVDNANFAATEINHAQLTLRGTLAKQELKGTILTAKEHYSFNISGQQLPSNRWQIVIPQLTMKSERFGNWQLTTPLHASLTQQQAIIQPACWHTTRQALCLQQASWQHNSQWSVQLKGQNLELGLLNPWLKEAITLQGHADLELSARAKGKETELNTNLAIGILHLSYRSEQQTTHNLIAHDINAKVSMDHSGLKSSLKAILLDQPLHANLELPGYNQLLPPDSNQPWRGEATFALNDLSILGALIPNISDVKGLIQLNLQLAGTLAKPSLAGKATLQQAGFMIPVYGTRFEQLQGSATGRNDGKINYAFTAKAGPDSNLKLTGSLDLFAKPITSKNILIGSHALIINTDEYQVVADPYLQLLTKGAKLDLTGNIFIPTANIKPSNFSKQVIELPEDVVIVGKKDVTTSSTVPLTTELKLKLGDNVNIDTKGLTGQVEGNMIIYDEPHHATTATGQLNILNGTYNVYGENLTIRNGRLIFAGGNLDNPGLNIQATRTIKTSLLEEIMVGVNVQGRLKQPKVNLFSEPANLSQADILSYILTGSPVNQLSGARGQLLFKAATALNPGNDQIGNLKKDLQSNLGLDELDLGTVQQYSVEKGMMVQNTSLMLGKQLTPRLHVGYSMGIAEHINTFTARFQLWRKLLLQTQTTLDNSGVDVIYTIERK